MNYVCQACNQAKATVHITDTVPEKRERHLCEACAQKEHVIVKHHSPSAAILQEFIKQKAGATRGEDLTCPSCGMTFREFQLKGQLGCPNDYEAFRELLLPLIERAHENAKQHAGKSPGRRTDPDTRRKAGLVRLRRELQDAIEQENYELAARVRDQIKSLENQ